MSMVSYENNETHFPRRVSNLLMKTWRHLFVYAWVSIDIALCFRNGKLSHQKFIWNIWKNRLGSNTLMPLLAHLVISKYSQENFHLFLSRLILSAYIMDLEIFGI